MSSSNFKTRPSYIHTILTFISIIELAMSTGGVVREKFGVLYDTGSTLSLLIIFCCIQVNGEYGWRRFVLDGRRGFTDYSTVVFSGGWRSGFHRSRRAKGLAAIE
ncbi:hypothetical protein Hanom_Chr00s178887g01831341 [Helianthus anomalus]